MANITQLFYIFCFLGCALSRIHHYEIQNDTRKFILFSSFGYTKGGFIGIKIRNFQVKPENDSFGFGFSVHQTTDAVQSPDFNSRPTKCILRDVFDPKSIDVTFFNFDLKFNKIYVRCNMEKFRQVYASNDDNVIQSFHNRENNKDLCGKSIPLRSSVQNGLNYYNTSFEMFFFGEHTVGSYEVYFHNCDNYESKNKVAVDAMIDIVEHNRESWLSAGEIPLPAVYISMIVPYFPMLCLWSSQLIFTRHPTFKIHYMMTILILFKIISLIFQTIKYSFIDRSGTSTLAMDILFDIVHFLKQMLFFTMLMLLGTGWNFVKAVLSTRDKCLLIVLILLQILSNCADVMLREYDYVNITYKTWKNVYIFVDLASWLCIFISFYFSIRNPALRASTKTAVNFKTLFKHFFIILVCYVYTTRVMVYLLLMCLTYQYDWVENLLTEVSICILLTLTLYKFRPSALNSYSVLTNLEVTEGEDY